MAESRLGRQAEEVARQLADGADAMDRISAGGLPSSGVPDMRRPLAEIDQKLDDVKRVLQGSDVALQLRRAGKGRR
jgi:hypothetical protein